MSFEYKSSKQLAEETGLSRERINQCARLLGVPMVGASHIWNKEQEAQLYDRMGMRGRSYNKEKRTPSN